jgi:hypothetical protein
LGGNELSGSEIAKIASNGRSSDIDCNPIKGVDPPGPDIQNFLIHPRRRRNLPLSLPENAGKFLEGGGVYPDSEKMVIFGKSVLQAVEVSERVVEGRGG